MGVYEAYKKRVEEADGDWVDYPGQFRNPHIASSAANQLRRRWPHFEIKQSGGVIRARVRTEGES